MRNFTYCAGIAVCHILSTIAAGLVIISTAKYYFGDNDIGIFGTEPPMAIEMRIGIIFLAISVFIITTIVDRRVGNEDHRT